jgi:anti-repressor protein
MEGSGINPGPRRNPRNVGFVGAGLVFFPCPDGHVQIDRTTKVTGKGQVYFVNRFLGGDCGNLSITA